METLLINSVNPIQVELTDFVGNPEVVAREGILENCGNPVCKFSKPCSGGAD
jgi:hypothetical protein